MSNFNLSDLTYKQRAFINYYVTNGNNGTQAAISAGYSVDTAQSIASENLYKPIIKAAIAEREKQKANAAAVTYDYKLEALKSLADFALREIKNTNDETVALKNHKALTTAIAELNKMQGHHSAQKIIINNDSSSDNNAADKLIDQYKQDK